jgi:hypothetical protein
MNTQPEQPARKTNQWATASLGLGILGILPGVIGWWAMIGVWTDPLRGAYYDSPVILTILGSWAIGLLCGLGGLITGTIALIQIKKNTSSQKGKYQAITGIVLGILNSLPVILSLLWGYLTQARRAT